MLKFFKYIIAYISLILLWGLIVLTLCSIFNLYEVDTNPGIILWGLILAHFYHKFKPMKFRELLEKLNII